MTTLKYLSLTKSQRFVTNVGSFFKNFFKGIGRFFKGIPHRFYMLGRKIAHPFEVLADAWKKGSWQVRLNFLVFGFYQLLHKEVARGILYLLFEIVFIWFMIVAGGFYLGKLGSLGTFSGKSTALYDVGNVSSSSIGGDESFFVLLYSLVTILFIVIFIVLWYFSIRDARSLQNSYAVGKHSKNSQFFKDLLDSKYHTLLLAIPMVGLVAFTVIPIIFMIIIGFTNYSTNHLFLFDWVGAANYQNFFAGSGASSGNNLISIFLRVLAWTLIWALIATFTNYFLGMAVALLINKKGIKLKKLWRTVLILTIAVPQFVSLLLIQQMVNVGGFLNDLFVSAGWIAQNDTPFSNNVLLSRIIIIVVNMWVGVPYTMLISSGLLMNIPEDLYESARIDGATPFKMFSAITLPYMLFITGPYLLSQFIGNINNFNIIYLLSQGYPQMASLDSATIATYGRVGETDLLITWIYKMSMEGSTKNYATACVLGVLVFVVIAFFSLIFYGRSNSVKNEGDFQ